MNDTKASLPLALLLLAGLTLGGGAACGSDKKAPAGETGATAAKAEPAGPSAAKPKPDEPKPDEPKPDAGAKGGEPGFPEEPAFEDKGPETFTLAKDSKKGPVSFPHHVHAKDLGCVFCHHTVDPAKGPPKTKAPTSCRTCHGVDDAAPGLKKMFHDQCRGCHDKFEAGPRKCKECHKKAG